MEEQKRIEQFLGIACYHSTNKGFSFGDGSGNGSGDGSDSGNGFGDGSGDGSGDSYGLGLGFGYNAGRHRSGSGYCEGDGYGDGYGDGVTVLNGERVYQIDDIPTLIDSVSWNFAKGRILLSDLTTRPCYIAKVGKYFAHGDTLREAMADAQAKYNENRPLEERIADFNH